MVILFLRSQISVLAIQEHRVVHDEEVKIERHKKGVHLITTSAWRNRAQASTGGVGFLLTKQAFNAVSLIKTYSKRCMLVSLDGNPRLTIISVYIPTESATVEEAEAFHDCLRAAVREVPSHHQILVIGDLNAHLSKLNGEDTGWYWHQVTNRNGHLLRDTLLEGELEATNHRFQKSPGKQWTHLSDGVLTRSQIDYVLYGKFIEAVKYANRKHLPHKPKKRYDDPANDPRVEEARSKLFAAKETYHDLDPCEDNRQTVAEEKDTLSACYRTVEEELLKQKIRKAENAADRCKNKESWNLVNEVSGRKNKPCGLVEGGSREDRLRAWKNHVTKLLGQPPVVPNEEVDIPVVHPPQNISVDKFTKTELEEATKSIKEGKAFGEDGVAPEVLKRVDVDDLILDFCNKALVDGDVPDQ
ncbi:uncharacterized protein LOC134815440 [Bolinopsis microptera]|uniref:uncharacterized protein LOC134815440 n=1 Tax=Bolinopsis microptera TaxID=2820187 RepID=UPI00307ABBF1